MNSDAAKIVLGNVLRSGLVALISFLITKRVIEADVASKLMRGDTLSLWQGAIPVNLTMVVNVLVGLAAPIILPLIWGIWTRTKAAYEAIVARSEAFAMSKEQVKDRVDNASVTDIIKTVAAN